MLFYTAQLKLRLLENSSIVSYSYVCLTDTTTVNNHWGIQNIMQISWLLFEQLRV